MIPREMCAAAGAMLALMAPAPLFAATAVTTPMVQADASAAEQLDDKVLELVDTYDDAYSAWRTDLMEKSKAFREAREDNPDAKFERPKPIEPDFWPKFDRFASAGSSRAQGWCIKHYQPAEGASKDEQHADFTRRVMAVLLDPNASLAELPRTVFNSTRARTLEKPTAEALLVVIEQVAADADVRSNAAYMRVAMNEVRGGDEAQKAKTLEGYRAVAAAYPDQKYGQRAGGKVFVAERLNIGQVAPDIVGADVDGNPMKLSDFRGKVTVIDFWGFW